MRVRQEREDRQMSRPSGSPQGWLPGVTHAFAWSSRSHLEKEQLTVLVA